MYNTPITRIACVLAGYIKIIDSYKRNLVMNINQDFHLAHEESCVYIRRNPESLHNLKSEPGKALEIVTQMKYALKECVTGKKDIDSINNLLKQHASCLYQNNSDALLFAKSVICRIIELVTDDSQFSEFSYF